MPYIKGISTISDFFEHSKKNGESFTCPFCEIDNKRQGVIVKFYPSGFNVDKTGKFVIECQSENTEHTIIIESSYRNKRDAQ